MITSTMTLAEVIKLVIKDSRLWPTPTKEPHSCELQGSMTMKGN